MASSGSVIITPGYLIQDGEEASNAKFRLMASPIGQVSAGAIGQTQLDPGLIIQSKDFVTGQFSDGIFTVGSTTITSATANFASTDIGSAVVAPGIPTGAIIQSVPDAMTAVLDQAITIQYTDGIINGTSLTSLTANFTASDNGRTVTGDNFAAGTTLTFDPTVIAPLTGAILSVTGTNGTNVSFSISGRVQNNSVFTIVGRGVGWQLEVNANGKGIIQDYAGVFSGVVATGGTVIEEDGSLSIGQGLNTMFVDSSGNASWGNSPNTAGFTNVGGFFSGGMDYPSSPVTIAENGNVTIEDTATNTHQIATGAINPFVQPVYATPPGGAIPSGGTSVILSCGTTYSRIYYRLSPQDGVSTASSETYTSAGGIFTTLDVGKPIAGNNIVPGTYIQAVASNTSITLSVAATGSGTGLAYTVTPNQLDTLYTGPFSITATRFLAARAYKNGEYSALTNLFFSVDSTTTPNPEFSPVPGVYGGGTLMVTISSPLAGAQLRYTTGDGTQAAPTTTTGIGPFGNGVSVPSVVVTLSGTTNIQAIAFKGGLSNSGVSSGLFTIGTGSMNKVPTPTFTPPGFTSSGHAASVITIATTLGTATLRYTVDGSVPTPTHGTLISSNSGTTTVPAGQVTELQAIAFATGYLNSDTQVAIYNFASDGGGGGGGGGGGHLP